MTTSLIRSLSKAGQTAGLVLALACTLPVTAQTSGTGTQGSATTGTTGATDTSVRRTDDGFDWGWLGLLGLAGLMGMRRRDDVVDTRKTATTVGR